MGAWVRVLLVLLVLSILGVGALHAQGQPCNLVYGQRFVFPSFETETPEYIAECTFEGEEGDALRLISSIAPPNWVLSSEDGSYQVTSAEYLAGREIVLPVTGRYRVSIALESLETNRTTFIPNQDEQIQVTLKYYIHYGSLTLRRVALPAAGASPNPLPEMIIPEGGGLEVLSPNHLQIISTAYRAPQARPISEAMSELCTDESVEVTLSLDEIYVADAAEADGPIAAGGDEAEIYYALATGTQLRDFDIGADEIPYFTSEMFTGDSVSAVDQITRRIGCDQMAFVYLSVYESNGATATQLGRDIIFPLISEDTPGDQQSVTVDASFAGPIYDGRYEYQVSFTVTFGSTAPASDAPTEPPPPTPTRPPASTATPAPADDPSLIRQWAARAEATTEYSYPQYGAVQATGAPNTLGCGDSPTAWASRAVTNYEQLTLYYDTPVIPTAINIYQTFGRGSIVQVDIITSSGEIISLPDSADPPTNPPICPGVFTVDVSGYDVGAVNGVIITLDQTIRGMWNEIDAVELVGRTG